MFMGKTDDQPAIALFGQATMTRADLPDPRTRRWVASRKAAVLRAIDCGLIEREEAMKLYKLSDEELDGWADAMRSYGERGLKTTATQVVRQL